MVFVFYDPPSEPLACFLAQVFVTLTVTRAVGKLLGYFKQPRVVGEIIGGILLGPTVLGRIPHFSDKLFPQVSLKTYASEVVAHYNCSSPNSSALYESEVKIMSFDTFKVTANMGLIFFMFLMGLELEMDMLAKVWKRAVPIAAASICVPFGVGALCSLWWRHLNRENASAGWVEPDQIAFILFSGTVLSFTAFPVLCAVLKSAKLSHSTLGALVLSAAAIEDVVAWCILAIASSFSKNGNVVDGLYTTLLAIGFVLAMLFIVRPIVRAAYDFFIQKSPQKQLADSSTFACLLFLMLFLSAFTSEVIGIHAFFGAFIAGLIVPRGDLPRLLAPKIELVVREFLLPLFFANSGIRTDLGSLNSIRLWGITLAVVIIASAAKIIPAALVTRYMVKGKESWRFCLAIGSLMNTRGLVTLIALNVAIQYNILNDLLFTIFVIMALATTAMTSPLLWWLWTKNVGHAGDLEPVAIVDQNYLRHSPPPPEHRLSMRKSRASTSADGLTIIMPEQGETVLQPEDSFIHVDHILDLGAPLTVLEEVDEEVPPTESDNKVSASLIKEGMWAANHNNNNDNGKPDEISSSSSIQVDVTTNPPKNDENAENNTDRESLV